MFISIYTDMHMYRAFVCYFVCSKNWMPQCLYFLKYVLYNPSDPAGACKANAKETIQQQCNNSRCHEWSYIMLVAGQRVAAEPPGQSWTNMRTTYTYTDTYAYAYQCTHIRTHTYIYIYIYIYISYIHMKSVLLRTPCRYEHTDIYN
jgi:hypothetical protein